jgi:SIR2-like domain
LELSKFAKSNNRPKDWQARTDRLEELVRRVLIHTTCDLNGGAATPIISKIHQPMLSRLRKGDTLITFNYDTVIEEAMPWKTTLWTPRGGYFVDATGMTHDWTKKWFSSRKLQNSKKTQINLLKLHGSLNWELYATSKVRLKHRPYVVRARRGKPVSDSAAIVPPGWHKRVDRNPYNALWHQARLQLEKCATLVIVGYSLPETDLIAKALFLEAIRSRAYRGKFIQELHVADTSDLVRKRLIELFVPALGPHGNVFRYKSAQELADDWKA